MTMYERIKNMTMEEMRHFVYWVYMNGNEDGKECFCDDFIEEDENCSYFGSSMLNLPVRRVMPNDNVKEDLWNSFNAIYKKKPKKCEMKNKEEVTENKADNTEMKKIVLHMNYYYNGSENNSVSLCLHNGFGTTVFTDYGEPIDCCSFGDELAIVLMDLSEGKYA